jgi:hypothetical protein
VFLKWPKTAFNAPDFARNPLIIKDLNRKNRPPRGGG